MLNNKHFVLFNITVSSRDTAGSDPVFSILKPGGYLSFTYLDCFLKFLKCYSDSSVLPQTQPTLVGN